MTFVQGLLVFIIVLIGIIVWAFVTAEEMEDHE